MCCVSKMEEGDLPDLERNALFVQTDSGPDSCNASSFASGHGSVGASGGGSVNSVDSSDTGRSVGVSGRQISSLNIPEDLENVDIQDFTNPFIFQKLMLTMDKPKLTVWMLQNELLYNFDKCPSCGADMEIGYRKRKTDDCVWRCKGSVRHETHVRKFSFFDNLRLGFIDIMTFMKSYIEHDSTLTQICTDLGLNLGTTGYQWSQQTLLTVSV